MDVKQFHPIKTGSGLSKAAGLNIESNIILQRLPVGGKKADVIFLLKEGQADISHLPKWPIIRRDIEGEEMFAHFVTPSGYYLRYESVEFIIDFEAEIAVQCYARYASPELIWGIFVSDVMPYILWGRMIDVLHSSAIVLDGSGVAFVGYPGSGKSTLAAHFLKEGFPLLADDRLPLFISKEQVRAIPNFPGLRLCRDAGRFLFGDVFEQHPRIHSKSEKRFLYFGSGHREDSLKFQSTPVPLKRVYILKPGSDDISISSLSPKDAFFSMVPHVFDSRKPAQALFYDKCILAQSIQTRLLSFPRSFHVLPDLVEIIKDDCRTDPSHFIQAFSKLVLKSEKIAC